MSKKTWKGILIGVGITLGVLVIGTGTAYALLGNPPKLDRKVEKLEELLPRGADSYVVAADMGALDRAFKQSKIGRTARKLGIDEDFSNLRQVSVINERTRGNMWNLLGHRFIFTSYSKKSKLLITQPKWQVRTFWRAALSKGKQKEAGNIPYAVMDDGSAIAFAGDYFWFASSEKLMLKALDIAGSKIVEEDELDDVGEEVMAYGLSRKHGKQLTYDNLIWKVTDDDYGVEVNVMIDEPGGVAGEFLADAQPPQGYQRIPDDAVMFVSLGKIDAYKAWRAASKLAVREKEADALEIVEMEKPIASMATDLGEEVFFVMQGWDIELWYAPARWVFGAESGSAEIFEDWKTVASWLFAEAYEDTTLDYNGATYYVAGYGEDMHAISYLTFDGFLTVASDTALVPWMIDTWTTSASIGTLSDFKENCRTAGIEEPVAYVDWPAFIEEFKLFLAYAADRSSGFTPADVEAKIFPILDAAEISAVVVGLENKTQSPEFTIRFAE